MSIIIRLQNLPLSAKAADIREFFTDLKIPKGAVNIVGGPSGDAFIGFSSDEDARLGMQLAGKMLHGAPIRLMLSSRREMESVISSAHATTQASATGAGDGQSGGGAVAVKGSPHAMSQQSPAVAGAHGWGSGGGKVESPLASTAQQQSFPPLLSTSTHQQGHGQQQPGMGIDPQLQDWIHSQKFATPTSQGVASQGGMLGNEALSPPIGSKPPPVSSSSLNFTMPPPNPPNLQPGQTFNQASTTGGPPSQMHFTQPPPSFGTGMAQPPQIVVLGDSWKAVASSNQPSGGYAGNFSGQTPSPSGFLQKPPPSAGMGHHHQIQQVHQPTSMPSQQPPQKHMYQQQFVDRPAPVISQEFPSPHATTMQPPQQQFTGPPPPINQANAQSGSAGWGSGPPPPAQRFNQPGGRGNFGPPRGQKRPFGAFQGPTSTGRGGFQSHQGGGPPGRKFGRFGDNAASGPAMGGRGARFSSNPPQSQGFGAQRGGGHQQGQFGSGGGRGFHQSRDGGAGGPFRGSRGGGSRNFGERAGNAPFQQQRPWQQQSQQAPQHQQQGQNQSGEKKRICVQITNVPFKATFNEIKTFVLSAGPHQKYEKITRTYYPTRNFSDKWIVEFCDDRDARAVMRCRSDINGRRLHCDYITPRDADEQYAVPEPEENNDGGGGNRAGGGARRESTSGGRVGRDHGPISPVRIQPFNHHPPDPSGNAENRERRTREERKKSPDDGGNNGKISPSTGGNIQSLASIVFDQRPPPTDQVPQVGMVRPPRRRSTSQDRIGGGAPLSSAPRNGDAEWRMGHYPHHLRGGEISPIREPLSSTRQRRASDSENGPSSRKSEEELATTTAPIQPFDWPLLATSAQGKDLRVSSTASLDGSSSIDGYGYGNGGGGLMIAADQSSTMGEGEPLASEATLGAAMPGCMEEEEEYGERRMPPGEEMPGLEPEENYSFEADGAGNEAKDDWPSIIGKAPLPQLPPITAFLHLAHLFPASMTSLRLKQVPAMISADELASFLQVHIADPAANIARMTSGTLYVNLPSEEEAEKAVGRSGESINGQATITIERVSKREMAEAIAVNEQLVANKLIEDRLKNVAVDSKGLSEGDAMV